MKRTLAAVALMVALGILASCASMPGSPSPVIHRIQQKGELVVGTAGTMPPLNMTTKEGDIIGFDVDLAQNIASGMGVTLKLKAMPFSELLPALEAGSIDMIISGMTITPRRNLTVAFVGPYYVSGKGLLATSASLASIRSTSDLNRPGVTLVALEGSTSHTFARNLMPAARLLSAPTYDEAVDMLINGKADALVADHTACIVSALRYPEAGLQAVISPLTYEPLGIAVPAEDPLLVNWLENRLDTLKKSGVIEIMEKRWFSDTLWLERLP
jgi:polar amino acid transport system substrate-binding protein